MIRLRLAALSLLATTVAPPLHAQRAPFPIPDPDPEIERRSFQVAEGFEVNLFAADPVLAKPIQMNFGPDGRLWVVSSEVYPQIQPGQSADDKVLVLEDADGDGTAEKTTVFAGGLLIPTGVEPGDGGAYVANSTELLHFRDTDGDGKADTSRVLLSGFGTEDTHHIIHTFRWGFDGTLAFNQSIYIHSNIETPYGVRRLGGGGIWQFRPESRALEVFVRGMWNPWGHHHDRWGQQFATDGAGPEGITFLVPGASYVATPNEARVLAGLTLGSPKYSGLEVLSGRHLPDDWRGNMLTNDFRANRVCRFAVVDDGSGFAARELPELIKTSYVAFRPIDVKMGPDGAIYIADWFNPIIQHGEVDFRDPRRDHTRGRIWRVTAKGRPLVARPKLVGAPVADLLGALKAPEDWTRHQSRRVLKERGEAEVVPALAAWVKGLDRRDPEAEHHRLEALWTYQAIDVVEPGLLRELLGSPEPRARAAATRVAGLWHDRLGDRLALDWLKGQADDGNPRVRLEAVRAIARIPDLHSAQFALKALDAPTDRFLDYALWLTARDLQSEWLPAVREGKQAVLEGDHLAFALQAVGTRDVIEPLVKLLRTSTIPPAQQERVLTLIATLGGPDDLAMVFDLAVGGEPTTDARRAALLNALMGATARPSGDLTRLGSRLDGGTVGLRAASARAAGRWHVAALRPKLAELARAPETPEPVCEAAIEGLAQFGATEGREALAGVIAAPEAPPRAKALAIGALAALDPKAAAARAVEWLASARDPADAEGLLIRFLATREGPRALASALSGRTLPADVAKVAARAVRNSGRDEPALGAALSVAGGLGAAPRALSPGEVAQLAAEVATKGDPARGEAVFRRKDALCLKCHAIAGAGGQVGPGLESIGASAPVDYLVDSLLEPGKAIKEGYHALVVATTDGRVVTGIKVRQDDRALVLRDADDHEIQIPADAVDEQKPGGSLMPAGLTETLTRGELVDLVRFLSALGKVGPFAVGQDRVARRWRVLASTPESIRAWSRGINALVRDPGRLAWEPAYSTVAGTLPPDAVPILKHPRTGSVGLARAEIEVTTAGAVGLGVSGAGRLWVDGKAVAPGSEGRLELAAGTHTLMFAVEPEGARGGLRVALEDVPGSPAQARWVVGK